MSKVYECTRCNETTRVSLSESEPRCSNRNCYLKLVGRNGYGLERDSLRRGRSSRSTPPLANDAVERRTSSKLSLSHLPFDIFMHILFFLCIEPLHPTDAQSFLIVVHLVFKSAALRRSAICTAKQNLSWDVVEDLLSICRKHMLSAYGQKIYPTLMSSSSLFSPLNQLRNFSFALSAWQLEDKHILVLCDSLRTLAQRRNGGLSLKIDNNRIADTGLLALADLMPSMTPFCRINLSMNTLFTEPPLSLFCKSLTTNPCITFLNMSGKNVRERSLFGNLAAKALGDALVKTCLQTVVLNFTSMSLRGLCALVDGMQVHTARLRHLGRLTYFTQLRINCSWSCLPGEDMPALKDYLSSKHESATLERFFMY